MKNVLSDEDYDLCHGRILTEFSKDSHNILTPFKLVKEIIWKISDNYSFTEDSKVLILCNIEFFNGIYLLYKSLGINIDNIYFVTTCNIKAQVVENILSAENVLSTDNVLKYDNYEDFFEDNNLPKFDVIVGNPPYSRGLHLKFLEKSYDICSGYVKIIHPSDWLISYRETTTTTKYNQLKQKIGDNIESLEIYDAKTLGFDIHSYIPLSITTLNHNKTGDIDITNDNTHEVYKISCIEDFCIHGNNDILNSIFEKVKTVTDLNLSDNIDNGDNNFYISLSSIVGNGSLETLNFDNKLCRFQNRYNMVNSVSNFVSNEKLRAKPQKGKKVGNIKKYVSFRHHNEAQNFLDFLTKNVFCKFLTIIYTHDQHIDSTFRNIPWLDWTNKFDHSYTWEYFNFNKQEIELIYSVYNRNLLKK